MKKIFLVLMLIALTCSLWAAGNVDHIVAVGGAYNAMFESFSSDEFGDVEQSKSGIGVTLTMIDPVGSSGKWNALFKNTVVFPSAVKINGQEMDLDNLESNLMFTADYGAIYAFYNEGNTKVSVGPTLRLSVHGMSAENAASEFNLNAGLGAYLIATHSFNSVVNINGGLSASYSPFLWRSSTTLITGTVEEILFTNNFAIEPMIAIGFQL